MAITQCVLLFNPQYEFTASICVRRKGEVSKFCFKWMNGCESDATSICCEFGLFSKNVKCSHGYYSTCIALDHLIRIHGVHMSIEQGLSNELVYYVHKLLSLILVVVPFHVCLPFPWPGFHSVSTQRILCTIIFSIFQIPP